MEVTTEIVRLKMIEIYELIINLQIRKSKGCHELDNEIAERKEQLEKLFSLFERMKYEFIQADYC